MKIIEILNTIPLCHALAQEKGLSPRAKFMVARNLKEIETAMAEYDRQKSEIVTALGVTFEPLPENPDMSRLIFENKEKEGEFLELHKPLLETDVKLPHRIASLELISFLSAADLIMLGDFVDTSDLEA